jgi:hypothetical protein
MSIDPPPAGPRLDARLAALPRELAPERDLWPGIAAAIAPAAPVRAPRRWPYALAAGLALVLVAGTLGWRLGQAPAPLAASAPAGTEAGALLPAARFAAPDDAEFRATRAALEQTFHERLALLDTATRARIEQDLATIRHANDDIRRALNADPSSRVLTQLLESTTQQEFDLYATVSRNTEPVASRTRT